MSRKLSRGKRSPSTRLNDTVNQLPEGEYEDVIGLLMPEGRLPKWFELITFHRGKQPYPTAGEKAQFEGYDLNSLRVIALRKLDSAIAELRSGLPADMEAIASDLDTTPRDTLLQTLKMIQVTKTQAIRRCYLERLVKLLGLESRIIQLVYSGEERAAALQVCEVELRQAQANLVLAPQITHYRSEYLDKVIEMQAKAGILDKGLIRGYLESDFARLDVSAYPPLLMSEKTTLDEGFHALNGNGEAACQLAESVWNLDQESPFLSPIRRVMLMVRLNEYYVAFGNREKGRELIAQFSAFAPEAPQNRMTYLLRFLVVMLEWASENAGSEFLETAQGVFERNEEFILALPVSGNRSLVLITMMVAYLGKLEVARAKQLFDHLYREKDQKPPLLYRISGLICHLMILFEAHEIAELKHHAKNHRELMLEKGEFSIPAIHLLGFLQKNARRYATPKATPKVVNAYRTDLEKIIQLLEGFQELEGFRRGDRGAIRLFYEPFLQWLRAKRI